MDIYVGNLPYSVNDSELEQAFSQHGDVSRAKVILDRETGRSRGFGFVTIDDNQGAQSAIEAMNGTEMEGRTLVVNEARPKPGR